MRIEVYTDTTKYVGRGERKAPLQKQFQELIVCHKEIDPTPVHNENVFLIARDVQLGMMYMVGKFPNQEITEEYLAILDQQKDERPDVQFIPVDKTGVPLELDSESY